MNGYPVKNNITLNNFPFRYSEYFQWINTKYADQKLFTVTLPIYHDFNKFLFKEIDVPPENP